MPIICCYLLHNYASQRNANTLRVHTIHQMTALLPMMHCFIRANSARYTTGCSVLSIQCVRYNIKITKLHYRSCSLRVCCQAAKKEHKKGFKFSVKINYYFIFLVSYSLPLYLYSHPNTTKSSNRISASIFSEKDVLVDLHIKVFAGQPGT